MKKILEGLFDHASPTKREIRKRLQKKQKGKVKCFILLTCSEPNEDGTMEVDMKYEGERWLAAYLIKSAQGILEEQEDGGNSGL